MIDIIIFSVSRMRKSLDIVWNETRSVNCKFRVIDTTEPTQRVP